MNTQTKKKITLEDFANDAELTLRAQKSLEVARALDTKSPMPYSVTIDVAEYDVEDFFSAMTPKRFQLLKLSRKTPRSIAELAKASRRDPSAVSKDISKLAALGLVKVVEVVNAGHGMKKIVQPTAASIEVRASLFA